MRYFRGLTDLRTLACEVKTQGFMNALSTAYKALCLRTQIARDQRFDRKFGVDTCGLAMLSDLSIKSSHSENCVYYTGTPVALVQRTLSCLPNALQDFVFVDFGSGKGRILLVASKLPFKRIIGVEFARELHEIATHNIRVYKSPEQRCFDIESIYIDACEFEIPSDKCVLYFYRPFQGRVFQQVLDRIDASYRAHPRKMYVIYCSPFSGDPLKTLEYVKRLPVPKSLLGRIFPEDIGAVLYETLNDGT
jgi:hypothetical protein